MGTHFCAKCGETFGPEPSHACKNKPVEPSNLNDLDYDPYFATQEDLYDTDGWPTAPIPPEGPYECFSVIKIEGSKRVPKQVIFYWRLKK